MNVSEKRVIGLPGAIPMVLFKGQSLELSELLLCFWRVADKKALPGAWPIDDSVTFADWSPAFRAFAGEFSGDFAGIVFHGAGL